MAFLFISSSVPLLPVLPFPYLRGSYRFHPPMASVYRAWRGGGRYAVGGRRLDFAFRSSVPFYLSRSAVRSISPYRIEAGQCAPFLPARFLVSSVDGGSVSFSFTRYARPFVSFLFSSCPSRGASRGYSLRLARRLVLSRQFAGVSLSRLVWGVSSLVSFARLVKQSMFSRFAWRLVVSGRVLASRSFLFLSYFARCVSWPWRRLVICGFVSLVSWLRVSFSVVICHRGAWQWRGERAVRRYERCAVFVSSFSHRVMMMWRYE